MGKFEDKPTYPYPGAGDDRPKSDEERAGEERLNEMLSIIIPKPPDPESADADWPMDRLPPGADAGNTT
jgi:hypothetical protein